jgi:hypothetical protein
MFARLLVCALLIGTAGIVSAQTQTQPAPTPQKPAAQQLTPEQRAAIQKRNQELVSYANQILKMIDNDQSAQVWDGMSAVGKHVVTRTAFEQEVNAERGAVGAVKARRVVALYRRQPDGQHKLPAGTYWNVRYLTQFSDSKAPKIELVSFHQDSDNKLRLSGYALSDVPPQTAHPAPKQ